MSATAELIDEIQGACSDARTDLGFEPLVRIAIRTVEAVLIALVKRLDKRFSTNGGNVRPFPTQTETFEAAGVMLSLLRGGSPDYKPGDYVHAGLCVADFATQQLMQTSGEHFTATDTDVTNSLEMRVAHLEALQSYCAPGNITAQSALNWKQLVLLALEMVLPYLKDWLNKPAA